MRVRWIGLVIAGLTGCGGVEVGAGNRIDADVGAQPDAAVADDIDASPQDEPDAAVDPDLVLFYDFESALRDDGDEVVVVDQSGKGHDGVVRAPLTNTGEVAPVPRGVGEGSALQFPEPCDRDAQMCPRVHLEAKASEGLDPGSRDFAASFDILVPEPAGGVVIAEQNVMQKGVFGDSGQWKIEFSPDRRLSCIFHFPMEPAAVPVALVIPDALAVDAWYEVRCERRGSTLSLRVTRGVATGTQTFEIPEGLEVDIANGKPILVGGQDDTQEADQFYGSLDNVKVEIFAAADR